MGMIAYPEIGEIFTLEGDFDLPENKPIGMAQAFIPHRRDYDYWHDFWRYCGKHLNGKHSGKFRIVTDCDEEYFDLIKEWLEAKYGPTPPGVWMKIFHEDFPQHDGGSPICIMDNSWEVGLYSHFPYINEHGKPGFRYSGIHLPKTWRWIVSA